MVITNSPNAGLGPAPPPLPPPPKAPSTGIDGWFKVTFIYRKFKNLHTNKFILIIRKAIYIYIYRYNKIRNILIHIGQTLYILIFHFLSECWIIESSKQQRCEISYPTQLGQQIHPFREENALTKCHRVKSHFTSRIVNAWSETHGMPFYGFPLRICGAMEATRAKAEKYPLKQPKWVCGGRGNFKFTQMNVTLIQNVLGKTYILKSLQTLLNKVQLTFKVTFIYRKFKNLHTNKFILIIRKAIYIYIYRYNKIRNILIHIGQTLYILIFHFLSECWIIESSKQQRCEISYPTQLGQQMKLSWRDKYANWFPIKKWTYPAFLTKSVMGNPPRNPGIWRTQTRVKF